MLFHSIIGAAGPVEPSRVPQVMTALIALVSTVVIRRWARARSAAKRKAALEQPTPFVYSTHPVITARPGAYMTATASPIDSVRQLMGTSPRVFDPALASYLTVVPPKWMDGNPNDEEWLNVTNQDRARRDGPVVWGTIVQANQILFKQHNAESGASVIYSPDPWFDQNPGALGEIASQCYALKGTDPADPESAAFARMLTNELTRGMRMNVPSVFTGGRKVYHSSMLMPRKHLPKGYISGSYFPIWMDPQPTGAVVMVPAAYWPASLTKEWDREE